jgi:centrosomal protein CEP120
LQEIAALKRREESNAKSLLKKQQIELDHLRLRYLAAEENNLMRTDEKQLESLRHDLNKYCCKF